MPSSHEAAAAAGNSITEHVRALLDAADQRAAHIIAQAEKSAEAIEEAAQADAEEMRAAASSAAMDVLRRVTALEERLGTLVEELRADTQESEGGAEVAAVPEAEVVLDPLPQTSVAVSRIAENLRAVLAAPRHLAPRQDLEPEENGPREDSPNDNPRPG